MAKGAETKENLIKIFTKLFAGASFSPDGKEVRVNCIENGEPVQIKISLTMVKTPISSMDNLENKVIDTKNFHLTEQEVKELEETLVLMGIDFHAI